TSDTVEFTVTKGVVMDQCFYRIIRTPVFETLTDQPLAEGPGDGPGLGVDLDF
ncbi:MAG: hypothetical protein HC901_02125, partial [Bdellovibrionaceae bacterium]|nr:hypothetical protein [Pseudobdellovibrionaceae bacterium]